jgi:hypothetical protein
MSGDIWKRDARGVLHKFETAPLEGDPRFDVVGPPRCGERRFSYDEPYFEGEPGPGSVCCYACARV